MEMTLREEMSLEYQYSDYNEYDIEQNKNNMYASLKYTRFEARMNRGKIKQGLYMLGCIMTLFLFICTGSYAFGDTPLVSLLTTQGFRGEYSVVNQWGFVGVVLSYIISVFSIIGLALIMYSRMASLLYLAAKPFWNNVHAVKEAASGDNFLGITKMFGMFRSGQVGNIKAAGLDGFLVFFYGFMPDMLEHSDYGSTKGNDKLDADKDNALNYILTMAPSTILALFFFTIGFNGVLGQFFATVVSAMSAAAENIVSINLTHYVNDFFAAGQGFNFTIGQARTPLGMFQQNLAEDVYGILISKFQILKSSNRQIIGKNVQDWVAQNITPSQLKTYTGLEPQTSQDFKNVKESIIFSLANTVGTNAQGQPAGVAIPASNFFGSGADAQGYIVMQFYLGSVQQEANPWGGSAAGNSHFHTNDN